MLSLIAVPFTINHLIRSIKNNIQIVNDCQKSSAVRVFHLGKALLNLSYFSGICSVLQKGLSIVISKIEPANLNIVNSDFWLKRHVSVICGGVLSLASKLGRLSAYTALFIRLLEVYQTDKMTKYGCDEIDSSLINECFDSNAPDRNSNAAREQIHKFKKFKTALAINSLIDFTAQNASGFSSSASASCAIVILVTTINEIALQRYWNSQVEAYKKEVNLKTERASSNIVLKTAAFVSFLSLPFTTLPKYTPFATALLTGATLTGITASARR